ncbi:MAG: hypothetical protein IRZ26_08440 [Clostridia bacterium]|nr:hypothetical protein [Clostridia bacterium]MCL6521699.1 hypothetical protein [Bacillota bacterium]
MTPEKLSDLLSQTLVAAGHDWLVQTLIAAMPALWALALILQLARPYMLRMLRKFTLRFAADVWWMLYVLSRDLVLVLTFAVSVVCFFPDLVRGADLPLTGSLAAVLLFGALAVKLTRDADDDLRAYRWVSGLVLAGAVLFFVPQALGVEGGDQAYLAPVNSWLVTSSNPGVALALLYVSYAGLAAVAGYLFSHVLRTTGRPVQAREERRGATAAR